MSDSIVTSFDRSEIEIGQRRVTSPRRRGGLNALVWWRSLADYERSPNSRLLSLERPRRLLELLGSPQAGLRSLVVAGTKGKGSTAAMLQAVLRTHGQRVGLYTQPHLHSFRERIRIDERLISLNELETQLEAVRPACQRLEALAPELGRPTFYEVCTAAALAHFAEQRVDWAVLEIGLGGRLDAVNVVEAVASAITPLSLDHTQVLGDSLEQIAFEKAGIIHPRAEVVVAPQPPEAAEVIRQVALDRGAILHAARLPADIRLSRFGPGAGWGELSSASFSKFNLTGERGHYLDLELPLAGEHQAANAATAIACLEAAGIELQADLVRKGLRQVRWPGRMEVVGARPLILVDGAHNGASALALATALQDHFGWRRLLLIIGMSSDKDAQAILEPLLTLADAVVATASRHPRALPAEDVAEAAKRIGGSATVAPDVAHALKHALRRAAPEDLICVTGSLFVVAEAREAMGLAVPEAL